MKGRPHGGGRNLGDEVVMLMLMLMLMGEWIGSVVRGGGG